MRTIKFRALKDDISNCNWVYGNLIYDADGNPRIQEKNGNTYFTTCLKGTGCQYTGLRDRNGTEIYEGNLVRVLYTDWPSQHLYNDGRKELSLEEYKKSISSIGEVIYDWNQWKYLFKENGRQSMGSTIHGKHGECEVIGNIHQNKELIKTK